MRVDRWGPVVAFGGGAALAAVGLARVFPVFFRADDALYLRWVATHPNPLEAFVPAQAVILGVFRPLQNLGWWVLYRSFGLNPLPYQLAATLLLLACLTLLATLARRLFCRAAGWWAVAAFLAFFPYLISVAFWFSDLTFLLETALMLVALTLLARALASGAEFGWGVAAYALAVLAKEPAAFIVPAVAAALLFADWSGLGAALRRRGAAVVGGLVVAAAAVALLHPSLRARQGALLAGGIEGLGRFVGQRWEAYSAQLMGGAGAGLVALALLSVWSALWPRRRSGGFVPWLPAATALAAAVGLRRVPSGALAVLLACLVALVVLRRREGAGAAWFAVPFLGLLTVTFVVRTYLFEAAFGLALVAGAVLAEFAAAAHEQARRAPKLVVALAVCAVAAGAAVVGPRAVAGARVRLAALEAVSDARLNFRDAVDALVVAATHGGRVAVVEYADMGLDYVRDILPLPDIEKAHRQKTMMSHELAAFLEVAGRGDLEVSSLSSLIHLPAGSEALVLVMNRGEDAFLARAPLVRHLVFEAARGDDAAKVYRVAKDAG